MTSYDPNRNTVMGFVSGIIGGLGSFLLKIKVGILDDMMIAFITAFICGAAGVAGKEMVQLAARKLFRKKRKK